MKKRLHPVISILVLFMSVVLISGCKKEINKNDFLKKVLSNLEQIKSARYSSTSGGIPPGRKVDTIRSSQYWFGPLLIGLFYRRLNIDKSFALNLS